MTALFYLAAAVAVVATALAITRLHAIHALLYLIVSLLAVAVVFYLLGAPFVAALEVIVYAGAIMVLFVFAVMLLNQGPAAKAREQEWQQGFAPRLWLGPALLAAVLLAELLYVFGASAAAPASAGAIGPRAVGAALYGPYLLAVELAGVLLLAGLVAAFHLARRDRTEETT